MLCSGSQIQREDGLSILTFQQLLSTIYSNIKKEREEKIKCLYRIKCNREVNTGGLYIHVKMGEVIDRGEKEVLAVSLE